MEYRWRIDGVSTEEDGRKMGRRWEEEGRWMDGAWMGNEWGKRMDWEGVLSFFPVFFG